MDIIIKSQVDEFIKEFDYSSIKFEQAFEKFCNYCIFSKEYGNEPLEAYEIEQTSVGNGNDNGIDGIAIIVNGKLVYTEEEINDLIERNSFLDVDFCFIQAKTSTAFVAEEIGTFLFGIKDIFVDINEENEHPQWNQKITHYYELIRYIYNHSSKMTNKGLPELKLYYVTTGKWQEDNKYAKLRFEKDLNEIKKSELFRKETYYPTDAKLLQKLYTQTKNKEIAEIKFINKITLPEITGVGQAYYGIIPFSEYKKIVIGDEGNLKNVFYDNIRAFQGLNYVNRSIDKTIKDRKIDIFPLLNNGVTIIAKSITPAGNNFSIKDYQIVNGCQTSHVLFSNKDFRDIQNMNIPIRLIQSEDDYVKNQIIIATNNQTEIKREQLIALSEFQKDLEKFYSSISGKGKLYYERQSKQYAGDNNVLKNKIVSIPVQIISFTSMFLDEPHNVRGYYSKILENVERVGKYIFSNEHKLITYYTSGLAYNRLEELFKNEIIDNTFRKAKHHLLLAFRLMAEEKIKPNLNSNSIEDYCNIIIQKLLDDITCTSIYKSACEIILETVPDKILLDRHINSILTLNIAKKLQKYVQIGRKNKSKFPKQRNFIKNKH